MSDEQFYSKKDQRIMSSFIGQSLLYDYLTGALDPERKKAVEDYIQGSPDAQTDIQKIQNGLQYASQLKLTSISTELLDKVTVSSSYTQSLLDKVRFDSWSPALKMGIEGTIVALGITVFAIVIPWHKVMDLRFGSRDVILAEVDKSQTPSVATETETDTSSKEGVTFPDEGTAGTTVAGTVVTTTTLLKAVTPGAATIAAVSAGPTKPVTSTTLATVSVQTTATEKAQTAGNTSEKKQGVLYRGAIYITNVQAVTPKLVEKVQELGGRKAGQVELGWFKADSTYFHFTMPDGRYQELQDFFSQYGTLSIQQEAHERLMPEGIRRIIITVYEKK